MAATTAGCECPSAFTPSPASASRYTVPSSVWICTPSARVTAPIGKRSYVGNRAAFSRSRRFIMSVYQKTLEEEMILSSFWPHCRKEHHIAYGLFTGHHHHQPVHAESEASHGRHPVFERAQEILVQHHCLFIAFCPQPRLLLEASALIERIVEFAERIRKLLPVHVQLEPLDESQIGRAA